MTITTTYLRSTPAPEVGAASNEFHPDCATDDGVGLQYKAMEVMLKLQKLNSELGNEQIKKMDKDADNCRNDQVVVNQLQSIIASIRDASGKAIVPEDIVKYFGNRNMTITWQVDGKTATGNIDDFLQSLGIRGAKPADFIPDTKSSDFFNLPDSWIKQAVHELKSVDWLRTSVWIKDTTVGKLWTKAVSYVYDLEQAEPVQLDKGQLATIKSPLETSVQHSGDMQPADQLKLQATLQWVNMLTQYMNNLQTSIAEANKSIAQNIR